MFLASLIRSLLAWRRYRITHAALIQLDERTLADIGLNRSTLNAAAWETRNRRHR